jgi:hypothetical protein
MGRLFALGVVAAAAVACKPPEASAGEGGGPVSVEPFTSEGCSSRPPADGVPARMESDRVVALSWHVDDWNDVGWPDPYSSPASTARQRA